jgi:hypothetical protein
MKDYNKLKPQEQNLLQQKYTNSFFLKSMIYKRAMEQIHIKIKKK